jgi:hypothetical protein
MNFIEHIIEPSELLLAWQSLDEKHRTRYIVGKLLRNDDGEITLKYLDGTNDFNNAKNKGFEGYPAFQDVDQTYYNVLDAFMRRVPPRKRGDFAQYLEGLRIKPGTQLSDFALLGYSGARLPSDGFSIIHPFNNVSGPCELLLEAAGYRHVSNEHNFKVQVGDKASFTKTFYEPLQETAIDITVNGKRIGCVNRGLIATVLQWMNAERIIDVWVEKMNGTPGRPALYLYVKVSSNKDN